MSSGMVYLVGAGPGAADLLTLRAVQCLSRADFVIYDRLVSRRALRYARRAEHVCVDQLAESHRERWPHIHRLMIEKASQGQCVVRLKGGDPSLFAHSGEEAEALKEAGIPFEVVPGVTAALGAAAYAGFPLTHRRYASSVALVTGHEDPEKENSLLDWEALARFPGTLVFYMGLKRLEQISQALIEHGKDSKTPAALIHRATLGDQRVVQGTLETLPQLQNDAQLTSPTLTVVGTVLDLRPELSWFEQRPLLGKRIVITRPEHQSDDLLAELEELGAIAYSLPIVEITDPENWAPVDQAIAEIELYQWLVFTSANGVHYFIRRLRQQGKDLRSLGQCHLAVIGPATAETLRGYHLEPDLMPEKFISEDLVAELKRKVAGQKVLLARADRGRELLHQELSTIAEVNQVAVYAQRDVQAGNEEALQAIAAGEIDYVTLTSSNIAKGLARMVDNEGQTRIREGLVKLVSISPQTSSAIAELGWPVAAEAEKYNLPGVVEALLKHARQ